MAKKQKKPLSKTDRPTIGIFLEYVTAYDMALWAGIDEIAREQNINLISFMGQRIKDPEEFVAQNNAIYSLAGPQNIDGLIIFSAAITTYLSPQEKIAFCQRYQALPQVSIGQVIENVPSIVINNRLGLQELLSHLIRDHGYRQIAFINGPENHPDALERFQVYKDVLAQYGLPFDPRLVVPGDFKAESGGKAMQRLLDRDDLNLEAVFAANDSMAISAMKVLQERGIDIPEMIAVVGFDDIKESRYSIPPLSTVRQPIAQLGRLATELILAQLKGETVPLQVTLSPEMVLRQSCGCLPQTVPPIEVKPAFFSPLNNLTTPEFQLSPGQREAIGAEMEQLLPASPAANPPLIPAKQLLDAFLNDIQPETPNVFLAGLSQGLRQVVLAGGDITLWQKVVSTMRHRLLPLLPGGPVLFKAEDLWYRAQVLLGEIGRQAEAHRWLQARLQAGILAQISQRLITTFNTAQLMGVIATMLPQLGIKSGYLALYEPQATTWGQAPKYARLVLAFNETGRFELGPEGIRFQSRFLTPIHNFLPGRQRAMLMMSLYFKDDQLGFILLEMGSQESIIYQTLQDQISSALQGALLVQQVRNHALGLEAANRALQETQEQLIRQEKLAVLGQLAGGVAHEIRNPLAVISNAIYFLQLISADADQTTREYLDIITSRVDETAKIVTDLLEFSYTRLPLPETVEIGRLVAEVLERNPPPEWVTVMTQITPDLPAVFVDKTQISHQVLANLVTNAYQAMPDGGELTISAYKERKWVKLAVTDTGVGMPAEVVEKIFEPLYTTKAKGIGLGLAISKNLVEINGGTIEVESETGRGSTFIITLPFVQSS